ncbi:DUF922 domain-containing protein [Mucilaginibacter sp. dw_454]|uniref:DUF922 domain-containing protein n=1 Tax=Mucilaginibacter sp. dw_454 TaxID=2720079 RepID=UPI001BD3DB61|nr:DUF922 domain-containing protein [Mucilaginibacter sp. dw_454]
MSCHFVGLMCVLGISLCVNNLAVAQSSYRQLSVSDFKGAPRTAGDNAVAYTNCDVEFRYHVHAENNIYQLTFDVRVVMQPYKSWLDHSRIISPAMMERVLKHEQGHYNIACLEQAEILREAARTRFDANYQAEASRLFDRVHAKYEQLNKDYDLDTQHSLDNKQQHSWDVYFQRRMMYAPPIAKVGY